MKIILCGACGKMGHGLAKYAEEHGETVVCGVDVSAEKMPFPVYPSFGKIGEEADVVVDFSSAEGTEKRLRFCEERSLPIVLGATGYTAAQNVVVAEYSQRLAIFKTGNLSLGVNVLQYLAKNAARLLQDGFDAEIVERHHGEKKDAPSGTALMLAECVNEGFGGGKQNVYGRHGMTGARGKNEIGIHAVRGGNIVGEHEIMFAGEDEILTLSHSARSREVFAAGAIRAARWLIGRPAGLYDMDDLLSSCL